MQHTEYERRRRGIEEQLQADLELIRAGYQAKLRALELLWLASPGEGQPDASSVTLLASDETQSALLAALQDPAAPGAASRERRRGDVLADILEIFPHLPDVFDKSDVVRLLGYEPTRPSLHRAWSHLTTNGKIVVERYGSGRRPQRFRKVRAE